MCGIVGVIKTTQAHQTNIKLEKFFKCLLVVDQLRGEHSTGIFCVEKFQKDNGGGDFTSFKRALNATDFLTMEPVKKLVDNFYKFNFIIGHNRFATKGAINLHNAHPFTIENTILVHNGTINSFGKYQSDFKYWDVDSAYLTYLIHNHDPIEVLKEISGAYALVWYDRKERILRVIRNEERPLYWVEGDWGFAIASEDWMLDGAARYANLKITDPKQIKPFNLYEVYPKQQKEEIILESKNTNYKNTLDTYVAPKYGNQIGFFDNNPPNSVSGKKTDLPSKHTEIIFKAQGWEPIDNTKNKNWGTLHGWWVLENKECGVLHYLVPREIWEIIDAARVDGGYILSGTVDRHLTHKILTRPGTPWCVVINELKLTQYCEDINKKCIITFRDKYFNKDGKETIITNFEPIEEKSNNVIQLPHKKDEDPIIEQGEEDHYMYGCVMDPQGLYAVTLPQWIKISKKGCCYCSGNLEADVFDGDKRHAHGNCIMDSQQNLWCDECWINESGKD